MHVTSLQRRTLELLIGAGERPTFPPDLHVRLRDRIEAAVRGLEPPEPLFLTKARLTDAGRCQGRFDAALRREGPPFQHAPATAGGLLVHKAIELEVGAREEPDAHALVGVAADRLASSDEAFARYWSAMGTLERDELLMRAMAAVVLFRETFPPLRPLRSELAPMVEWRMRAELSGGALILDGRVDLSLGRQHGPAAGRLLIDLKGEGAWPEHAEDLRFYALVHTLRFGVPPYRVATVFLVSGEWQLEDVDERVLAHAADRVVAAARSAAALAAGREPDLVPGRYCAWCPRRAACPAAAADLDVAEGPSAPSAASAG
jgi:PD-(D/E)XK nuclease superfamily